MSVDAPQLSVEDEQGKWLGEAKGLVDTHARSMKAAIEVRNMQDVLKHASQMLAELRTSNLSPQNYYELYIVVFDELTFLEQYFAEEVQTGRKVEELYEIVQHAGNIVPRLYLLITVGSVYIKSKEAPAKDILKDLVEMCKGVQHPTRGLFLRHYLSTMTKNKLPDKGNEYEGEESGSVKDSVEFVLQNFKEMVWLWVRMEQKQIVKDPERRSKERETLRLLVGFNLTRLGNLEGIDLEMYVESVMPRAMDVIANSKDVIAQQYLTEVMIQVFPDEFHLAKIDTMLEMFTTQLMQQVNLQAILTSLMDRLGRYSAEVKESGEKKRKWERNALASMFDSFQSAISNLVASRPNALDTPKYIQTQLALLQLVLQAYPERYDRVNEMFITTAKQLGDVALESGTVTLVKRMLTKPVEHYGSISSVLDLDGWPVLLEVLAYPPRREVARDLCTAALKAGEPLSTVDHVSRVFEFIKPLVIDAKEGSEDDTDFEDDQILVAKMIHLFKSDSPDVQFKMYSAARKQFGQGGERRMRYTLAPLIFSLLKLAVKVKKMVDKEQEVGKVSIAKIMQYVKGTLEVLSRKYPGQALNIYLQAARVSDRCDQGEITVDLLDQAFLLYEEEISANSRDQNLQLPTMIALVASLKRLEDDDQDKFNQKLCSYSLRLLKKPDQCRAAAMCSHLFTRTKREDQRKKALECLQKSLKIMDSCTEQQTPHLFVDILNRYLYFFAACNEQVTAKIINVLWELAVRKISEGSDDAEGMPGVAKPAVQYENAVAYVKARQADANPELAERWAGIKVRHQEE